MGVVKMSDFVRKSEEEVSTGKPSVKDQMISIATERFVLGKDQTDRLFGIDIEGPNVALPFDGPNGVMGKIGLLVFRKTGKTPSSNANSEVKKLLQAQASERPVTRLPIRTGRGVDGSIVIDMGDELGRAIVVTPTGWSIVSRSPIPFLRTGCTSAMVEPVAGRRTELGRMRRLFNVDDAEWEFLLNWQVIALVPDIPHVMPILEGAQGAAKTTTTQMLVDVIDPSKAALNSPPKDGEALELAAGGSWVFALENISHVSPDLSDGLARLITGAATRKRELYSDDGIYVRELQRVVVLNGISITGLRPDVLDRSVTIRLNRPTRSTRKRTEDVESAYAAAAPAHLSRLLDGLSGALAVESTGAKLAEYGRMASFEQWLSYSDAVQGTTSLAWYRDQRRADMIGHVLDDPIADAVVLYLVERNQQELKGSSGQLLRELPVPDGASAKSFPTTAKGLTARLRMLQEGWQEAGWTVEEKVFATSKASAVWTIRPAESARKTVSPIQTDSR